MIALTDYVIHFFLLKKIRANISSINYDIGLSEPYEFTPTMLTDEEYGKIKEWRMV